MPAEVDQSDTALAAVHNFRPSLKVRPRRRHHLCARHGRESCCARAPRAHKQKRENSRENDASRHTCAAEAAQDAFAVRLPSTYVHAALACSAIDTETSAATHLQPTKQHQTQHIINNIYYKHNSTLSEAVP